MDYLDEIENALLQTSKIAPTGEAWFKEHWKPKFDKIRSLMISPELKEAVYEIVSQMMECEPWHPPFDELQNLSNTIVDGPA